MVMLSYAATLLVAAAGWGASALSTGKAVGGAYLVEFENGSDIAAFVRSMSGKITVRRELDFTLYQGVSFRFNNLTNVKDQVVEVAAMAGVKTIHQITVHPLVTPAFHTSTVPLAQLAKRQSANNDTQGPDAWSPHVMTQVDKLRNANITGAGISIAIVDTGVDYTHPALGGCFGEGCVVSFGYDLVGDDPTYDSQDPNAVTNPDPDPRDTCIGHGTHVSGIIAAQSNADYGIIGAATGVTLGMYKIGDCYGYYTSDNIIAGFNMAYESGADIISASVGNPSGWSEEPQSVVMQRIVDAGVPVIVSAANNGGDGLFYGSSPAAGLGVSVSGSVDNTRLLQMVSEGNYSVDGGVELEFGFTFGSPDGWANTTLPLYATTYDTSSTDDACAGLPIDTPDLSEYIVLIHRGTTCGFQTKVNNAVAFGARYILFYNSGQGTIVNAVNNLVGVGMVEETLGKTWASLLESGSEVMVTIPDSASAAPTFLNSTNTLTPGSVSMSSSWGPSYDLELITTATTPGGYILGLFPVNLGSYYVLSGTSMSAPMLASIYALIMEATGIKDPSTLRNMISATAKASLWNNGSATFDFLAPIPQQGSGLVQAYDAAYTTSFLSRSSISFNDTDHFISVQNFTISNNGSQSVTYKLGNVGAATAYTFANDSGITPQSFPNDLITSYATISFSTTSVTVGAGESEEITVTVTPPANLDSGRLPVWSGCITLNGTDGSNLVLPYMGVTGSMNNVTILDAANTYVASSNDASSSPVAADYEFTLPPIEQTNSSSLANSTDLPTLFVAMAFGSRLVEAYIISAADDSVVGVFPTFPLTNQPRVKLVDDLGITYTPTWDGSLADGSYVAAGSYKFLIKALHIFGDASVESDWDSAETVAFTITYLDAAPTKRIRAPRGKP